MRVDVVVIGAGLGGLACARDLVRAGTDVLLLEARDRPGGRVEGEVLVDGRLVQVGGEVVGTVHRRLPAAWPTSSGSRSSRATPTSRVRRSTTSPTACTVARAG